MSDLATHLARLDGHLARFRDTGILNLINGQSVAGSGGMFETRSPVELIAIGIGHDVTRYYKRAVTIVDAEQLGGADAHMVHSGVIHFIAEDDQHAIQLCHKLLSFLPSNNLEDPPQVDGDASVEPNPALESILPEEAAAGCQVLFEAVVAHVRTAQADKRRVIIAGWSDGSRDRIGSVLGEHGLKGTEPVSSLAQALGVTPGKVALAVAGMEQGFEAGDLVVMQADVVAGDRAARVSC